MNQFVADPVGWVTAHLNSGGLSRSPWEIPALSAALLVAFVWVVPLLAVGAGLPPVPLAFAVVAAYLVAIVALDRPIGGVFAGVIAMSTCALSLPLLYAETARANLRLQLADPFAAVVVLLVSYWVYRDRLPNPGGRLVVALMCVWVAWTGLAAVFGAGPSSRTAALFAVNQARWILYFGVGLLLATLIPLRVGVVSVAIAAVIHAPVAIVQSVIVGPEGLGSFDTATKFDIEDTPTVDLLGWTFESGYPIAGWTDNRVAFVLIGFLALVTAYYYLIRGELWQRVLAAIAIPVVTTPMILTWSDTVFIAIPFLTIASGIALAWRRVPINARTTARYRRAALGTVVATGIMTFGATLILGVRTIIDPIPVSADNLETRLDSYQAAINLGKEYPIFGVGGANYELIAPSLDTITHADAVHNTAYEFLSATGFVGLALFMALILSVVHHCERALSGPESRPFVMLVALWAAIGFGALSMLNLMWPSYVGNAVFWLLMGMVVSVGNAGSR
ncbi:O-antigen ligase family protein [Saliphagus infecundisoli]|uniref:O-antigen ligase family protein n=1 Tax=Saliphagus infecundisoli TaxID=1849069 RepID=A0ABD5QKY2_9EURY|nr:O-antigen ligase family protein [Saliphagus infecundisoli]